MDSWKVFVKLLMTLINILLYIVLTDCHAGNQTKSIQACKSNIFSPVDCVGSNVHLPSYCEPAFEKTRSKALNDLMAISGWHVSIFAVNMGLTLKLDVTRGKTMQNYPWMLVSNVREAAFYVFPLSCAHPSKMFWSIGILDWSFWLAFLQLFYVTMLCILHEFIETTL